MGELAWVWEWESWPGSSSSLRFRAAVARWRRRRRRRSLFLEEEEEEEECEMLDPAELLSPEARETRASKSGTLGGRVEPSCFIDDDNAGPSAGGCMWHSGQVITCTSLLKTATPCQSCRFQHFGSTSAKVAWLSYVRPLRHALAERAGPFLTTQLVRITPGRAPPSISRTRQASRTRAPA